MMKKLFLLLAVAASAIGASATDVTFTVKDYYPDLTATTVLDANATIQLNDDFTLTLAKGAGDNKYRTGNGGMLQVYNGGTYTIKAKEGLTMTSVTGFFPASTAADKNLPFTINPDGNEAVFTASTENNTQGYMQFSRFSVTYEVKVSATEVTYKVIDYFTGVATNTVLTEPVVLSDMFTLTLTKGATDSKFRTGNNGMIQVGENGAYTISAASGIVMKSVTGFCPAGINGVNDLAFTINDSGNEAVYTVGGDQMLKPNNNMQFSRFTIVYEAAGGKEQCAEPEFSIPSGSKVAMNAKVDVTCATEGATLHYIWPNKQEYTEALPTTLTISASMTIEAWTSKEGMDDSKHVFVTYTTESARNAEYIVKDYYPNVASSANVDVTELKLADNFMVTFEGGTPGAKYYGDGSFRIMPGCKMTLVAAKGVTLSSVSFFNPRTQQTLYMDLNSDATQATYTATGNAYTKVQKFNITFYGEAEYETLTHDFAATEFESLATTWTEPWTITLDNIKFTITKNNAQNNPTYNTNYKEVRLYSKSSLKVQTLNGSKITDIVFTLSDQGIKRLGELGVSSGLMQEWDNNANKALSWSGTVPSVTFTVPETATLGSESTKAAQLDFTKISVTVKEPVLAVESIASDNNENAPVEYYNLQGIRIAEPQNGIFIRRQGNRVSKVLVK